MKAKYSFYLPFFLLACKNTGTVVNENDSPEMNFSGRLTELHRQNSDLAGFQQLAHSFKGSFILSDYRGICSKFCEEKNTNEARTLFLMLHAWIDHKCIDIYGARDIISSLRENHNPSFVNFLYYLRGMQVDKSDETSQALIASFWGLEQSDSITLSAFKQGEIAKDEGPGDFDIEDFGQLVRSINQKHEIVSNDWEKFRELSRKLPNGCEQFNEAICAVDADCKSACSGNDIVSQLCGKIKFTDASLAALTHFIPSGKEFDFDKFKILIPLCGNVTQLNPVFEKYEKNIDVPSLQILLNHFVDNARFNAIIENLEDKYLGQNEGDDVLEVFKTRENLRLNRNSLNKILNLINNKVNSVSCLIPFLVNNVGKDVSNLDFIFDKCAFNFNINCLRSLLNRNIGSERFCQIIDSIGEGKFVKDVSCKDVLYAFRKKNIKLTQISLTKIFGMISNKVGRVKNLFVFLFDNVDKSVENLDCVFGKYNGGGFDFNCLKELIQHPENFESIITRVSSFKSCKGDDVLAEFVGKNIKLTEDSLPKILGMISDDQKISTAVTFISFLINNIEENIGLDNVFGKYNDGSFDLDCLQELIQHPENFESIITRIPKNNFKNGNKESDVLKCLVDAKIELNDESFERISVMSEAGGGRNNQILVNYVNNCCNGVKGDIKKGFVVNGYGKNEINQDVLFNTLWKIDSIKANFDSDIISISKDKFSNDYDGSRVVVFVNIVSSVKKGADFEKFCEFLFSLIDSGKKINFNNPLVVANFFFKTAYNWNNYDVFFEKYNDGKIGYKELKYFLTDTKFLNNIENKENFNGVFNSVFEKIKESQISDDLEVGLFFEVIKKKVKKSGQNKGKFENRNFLQPIFLNFFSTKNLETIINKMKKINNCKTSVLWSSEQVYGLAFLFLYCKGNENFIKSFSEKLDRQNLLNSAKNFDFYTIDLLNRINFYDELKVNVDDSKLNTVWVWVDDPYN